MVRWFPIGEFLEIKKKPCNLPRNHKTTPGAAQELFTPKAQKPPICCASHRGSLIEAVWLFGKWELTTATPTVKC